MSDPTRSRCDNREPPKLRSFWNTSITDHQHAEELETTSKLLDLLPESIWDAVRRDLTLQRDDKRGRTGDVGRASRVTGVAVAATLTFVDVHLPQNPDTVLEILEALVADNVARGPGTVVAATLSASLECVA